MKIMNSSKRNRSEHVKKEEEKKCEPFLLKPGSYELDPAVTAAGVVV